MHCVIATPARSGQNLPARAPDYLNPHFLHSFRYICCSQSCLGRILHARCSPLTRHALGHPWHCRFPASRCLHCTTACGTALPGPRPSAARHLDVGGAGCSGVCSKGAHGEQSLGYEQLESGKALCNRFVQAPPSPARHAHRWQPGPAISRLQSRDMEACPVPSEPQQVYLTINGRQVEVPEGSSILTAATQLGIHVSGTPVQACHQENDANASSVGHPACGALTPGRLLSLLPPSTTPCTWPRSPHCARTRACPPRPAPAGCA